MDKPLLPTLNGIPILPNLGESLPYIQGNILHVRPRYGSDVNAIPNRVERAYRTISKAFADCEPNRNDTILFYGEGNPKAQCSEVLASQMDWNKDFVHLVGVHSGVSLSPRARIECAAAYDAAPPIFKVSANGCLIKNVEIILETTGTTSLGALEVTGTRNRFVNNHIYGFANAASDLAGAYSLYLNNCEENEFINCQVGSDRIAQGAQVNSQILVDNTAKNNLFQDSIIRLVSTHATNHLFVIAGSGSLDGSLVFRNTIGVNSQSRNVAGLELTYAMAVHASAGGDVILDVNSAFQATDLNSTDAGNVYGAGAGAGILVPLVK